MTKNAVIAEILYGKAIGLKKYKRSDFLFTRKRSEMLAALSEMQYLVHCLPMRSISDEQAREILNIVQTDRPDLTDVLIQANDHPDYAPEYEALLLEMSGILTSCIANIAKKQTGARESALSQMKVFHNLPRTFLSLESRQKISIQEARDYAGLNT